MTNHFKPAASVLIGLLLSSAATGAFAQAISTAPPSAAGAASAEAKLDALEAELAALRAQVADLKAQSVAEIRDLRDTAAQQPKAVIANGKPGIASADGKFTANFHVVTQIDAADYFQQSPGNVAHPDLRPQRPRRRLQHRQRRPGPRPRTEGRRRVPPRPHRHRRHRLRRLGLPHPARPRRLGRGERRPGLRDLGPVLRLQALQVPRRRLLALARPRRPGLDLVHAVPRTRRDQRHGARPRRRRHPHRCPGLRGRRPLAGQRGRHRPHHRRDPLGLERGAHLHAQLDGRRGRQRRAAADLRRPARRDRPPGGHPDPRLRLPGARGRQRLRRAEPAQHRRPGREQRLHRPQRQGPSPSATPRNCGSTAPS
ncbi:MAG: hypothetical protein WDN45_11450 [Caulobacteraceae bacterium]